MCIIMVDGGYNHGDDIDGRKGWWQKTMMTEKEGWAMPNHELILLWMRVIIVDGGDDHSDDDRKGWLQRKVFELLMVIIYYRCM